MGRQRLRVGHIEGGAADHAVFQCPHEIVSDDMGTTGDIDNPRMRLHHFELGPSDESDCFRGEREGEKNNIGSNKCIDKILLPNNDVCTFDVLDISADNGDAALECRQQTNQ